MKTCLCALLFFALSVRSADVTPVNPTTPQSANTVWAGPTTGAAAIPQFRSLVSSDIPTVAAAAGTLTGTTLASNVVTSSLTSVGTLGNLTVSNPINAPNQIGNYATIVTAAGITTLTVSSTYMQFFTGSNTQTVVLPVASTLTDGQQYAIVNNSSLVVTVQTSGSNVIQAMQTNSYLQMTCVDHTAGTGTASWSASYSRPATSTNVANTLVQRDSSGNFSSGAINNVTLTAPAVAATLTIANNKTFAVNNTLTLIGTDSTQMTFPATSATIARIDAANTFTGVQTMTNAALTTPTITTQVVASGLTATGSTSNDFSGSSGTFKTSTGAVTLGGATTINGPAASTALTLTQTARTSGVLPYIKYTIPTDTAQTASTESPGIQGVTGTRTWATTGTVALQREIFFPGPTYASASASQTFTDVFNMYLTPPVQGSNAIFTRDHTLGIVDSTSAASSITGGLVVATTLGTAGTSVGIGGGNINAGGSITTGGAFVMGTAGSAISIKSGTGQRCGDAILVGGTVTVTNSTVTASTKIILTLHTAGGTIGNVTYTTSAATSFTLTSDSGTDTSTYTYLLIEVP